MSKRIESQPQRLGILGGGQLARMLALAAHRLGVEPWIYSVSSRDPAAQVTAFHTVGSIDDKSRIQPWAKNVDVVTFESEFMERGALQGLGKKLAPGLDVMIEIQDRLTQKQRILDAGLTTLPFFPVSSEVQAQTAMGLLGGTAVMKARRLGYDGYGTFILRSERDLRQFVSGPLKKNSSGFIAEPLTKFSREVAIIVARGKSGEIRTLPWVETFQKDSRCLWVKGPVTVPNSRRWENKLGRFLAEIGYVGCMGIEFFEVQGQLVINELAPRVHNSGHYSQDALNVDQFELHVRAVLGWPLPKVELLTPGFAMHNLLGRRDRAATPPRLARGRLHWYGKSEERRGRKMGHVNFLGPSPGASLRAARLAALESW